MLDLTPEAQALRERISRYSEPTRDELDRILKIEFQFVQLWDLILRLYPLAPQTQVAIACLEESRTWAGLSVKRGQQEGYKQSDYPTQEDVSQVDSQSVESVFDVVLYTVLSRCIPNREMDLALARLHDARTALNLDTSGNLITRLHGSKIST
jgi:hypothetical protein